ncbi:MAG: methionyl-tRNA formyltransferase [Candidatus Moranbacteria bacterium]|nr:methionyl-tRNA formyltransferase [Candidatus Moranbacteria bacterium]
MSQTQNNPIKLQTVFMGTGQFATIHLTQLLKENYNITSIYTQREDGNEKKQKDTQQNPIEQIAQKRNIPIRSPQKWNAETIEEFQKTKPDMVIVASYGKILPEEVLGTPGFGCINAHPSLLPKYRGPSPIQNTLLNGDTETGVTIMLMDTGMDTGPIIAQEKSTITPQDTTPELLERLGQQSANLLTKTLPQWVERTISPTKQDKTKATLCQMIDRQDGKIHWAMTTEEIINRYRALTPWPGIFTFWKKDGSNIRLKLIHVTQNEPLTNTQEKKQGEVFAHEGGVYIKTMNGSLEIEEIQREGKKAMSINEFIAGHNDFINSILT